MSASQPEPLMQSYFETILKTGIDRAFREKFAADPRAALAEIGLVFSEDVELVLVEDTPKKRHVVLPVFVEGPLQVSDDVVALLGEDEPE